MNAMESILAGVDRLSAPEFRSGVLLLSVAMLSNGYANFSHEEAGILCGTDKNSTMRTHLIHLRDVGVLSDYSTNGTVRIKFAAYPGKEMIVHRRRNSLDEPTNSLDEPTNSLDEPTVDELDHEERSLSQLLRALRSRDRALSQQFNRNFADGEGVGRKVGIPTLLKQGDQPSNPPGTIDLVEEALSVALLLDKEVRCSPKDAYKLAKIHQFTLIREAVAHWYMNRRSMPAHQRTEAKGFDETPGVVVWRLNNLDRTTIPPLSEAFKRTDLYQRHLTADERQAQEETEISTEIDLDALEEMDPIDRQRYWLDKAQQKGWAT